MRPGTIVWMLHRRRPWAPALVERETLNGTLIGALCAAVVLVFAPPAQDLAAHVYRASAAVRDGHARTAICFAHDDTDGVPCGAVHEPVVDQVADAARPRRSNERTRASNSSVANGLTR